MERVRPSGCFDFPVGFDQDQGRRQRPGISRRFPGPRHPPGRRPRISGLIRPLQVLDQRDNQPPTITSTTLPAATAGQPYLYQVTGADPDDDPLQWGLVSGPTGLAIDSASGVLAWATPSDEQIGNQTVVLRLDDGQGGEATKSFRLEVHGPGQPPMIETPPLPQATVNQPYSYQFVATDQDHAPRTYTLLGPKLGDMGLTGTGLFTWTPPTTPSNPTAPTPFTTPTAASSAPSSTTTSPSPSTIPIPPRRPAPSPLRTTTPSPSPSPPPSMTPRAAQSGPTTPTSPDRTPSAPTPSTTPTATPPPTPMTPSATSPPSPAPSSAPPSATSVPQKPPKIPPRPHAQPPPTIPLKPAQEPTTGLPPGP